MSDPSPTSDLSTRDLAVLRHVARFKQLSAKQIRALLFTDVTTDTPSDRTLLRLVERSYLRRIERRLVGGARGGSGQYVYELGRRGHFLFYTDRHNPRRTVDHHSIAIADVYIAFKQLEREGVFSIVGMSTEPDCWVTIGGVNLRPDMRIDVEGKSRRQPLWLEIDMATEAQKQIRAQLDGYYKAFDNTDGEEVGVFPLVIWLAIDEERARELTWIISQMPENARRLFRVSSIANIPTIFGRPVDK